eukprot:421716-Rhodomonas_salina.1
MAPPRGGSSRKTGAKRGGDALAASAASKRARPNGAFANGVDGEVSEDDDDSVVGSGAATSESEEE